MKVQISERLLLERKRLGLTQSAMAAACGVAVRTYNHYESGERTPDAECLANLYSAGADVLYIITGELNNGQLEPIEVQLLVGFRALDTRGRGGVLGMIAGYNAVDDEPSSVPGESQFKITGDVAQIISGGEVNQTGATISTGKRKKK